MTKQDIFAIRCSEKEALKFARECAFRVSHLWDAPQDVLFYLGGGDMPREKAHKAVLAAGWPHKPKFCA